MLHTFFLGPVLVWCRSAMWALLSSGVWGGGVGDSTEQLAVSLAALKNELARFYDQQQRAGVVLTRVNDLTPKMVGSFSAPKMKLKAMEAYGMCAFLVSVLPRYQRFVASMFGVLHESGTILLNFYATLKASPARVSVATQQQLLDAWKRYVRITEPLFINIPKVHLMFHLVLRMEYQGNPLSYHTFTDEGMNKVLKKVLRNCHQATFETTSLAKMTEALSRASLRARHS
eukprot:10931478-Alexandrium_andersonii.AAC.1